MVRAQRIEATNSPGRVAFGGWSFAGMAPTLPMRTSILVNSLHCFYKRLATFMDEIEQWKISYT